MLDPIINESLRSCRSLEDLMKVAKIAARSIAQSDGATIVLRDGEFCYYADEDAISPLWKGQRFNLTKCISGWAMIHGKQACISNVFVDERIPHEAYRRTFVKSLVMTPMASSNAKGAMGVYWAKNYDLQESTRAELTELARMVGANLARFNN